MKDQNKSVTTTVRKLPSGWKHPTLKIDMGGQWGTYWGNRLMFVDESLEDVKSILESCDIKYEVVGNA
jgi:hypothetical protein